MHVAGDCATVIDHRFVDKLFIGWRPRVKNLLNHVISVYFASKGHKFRNQILGEQGFVRRKFEDFDNLLYRPSSMQVFANKQWLLCNREHYFPQLFISALFYQLLDEVVAERVLHQT
jgi:hypothetical protein